MESLIRTTIAPVSNLDKERAPPLSSRRISIKPLDRSDRHVAIGLAGVRNSQAAFPRQEKQFCAMTSGDAGDEPATACGLRLGG